MLAKTAPSLEGALQQVEPAAVEWKLDGVRIQVHRDGDDIAVFTRTLDPIGERMPEVVEAVRALPLGSVILDGEAIALRPDGRPRPFQETASRAASRGNIDALREAVPLTAFFFDVLHLDGRDLLDLPASERLAAIEPALPGGAVPRLAGNDLGAAQAFLDDALARGHEGVVVKAQTRPTRPAAAAPAGSRSSRCTRSTSSCWRPSGVTAAARAGSRTSTWARATGAGGFVMLGKTFKGLTDELLSGRPRACSSSSRPHGLDRLRPPRARRRDRLRRHPDEHALPGRRRVAIRAGAALPRRQAPRGGGHDRDHPHAPRGEVLDLS